jgi:YVTN family beta-propeller protein
MAGCSDTHRTSNAADPPTTAVMRRSLPAAPRAPARTSAAARNVYAWTTPSHLSPAVAGVPARVYVPNTMSNTVDVIDQATMRVVAQYPVGNEPQHVTPAWNLRTLYADNDQGNSLTPIDPRTGLPRGPAIPVDDPYNLYFTPNGRYAIVVAERLERLDFRNPDTMALLRSVSVPCHGVDHLDFTADGAHALASCEFSGQVIGFDTATGAVTKTIKLPWPNARPQDVKLSPDGRSFFVADMMTNGVWVINAATDKVSGFIPTGRGAHGLYPSRDARFLYVSNRDEGSVSVISFATMRVVQKWVIPLGTPDMGGVSVDGSVLWLSGRYAHEVYAISTRDGRLLARIQVGIGPHGMCVWPQPGRYSIGHTGNMR